MTDLSIVPGAEPWSHEDGRVGALCLHGFTGNPNSMRPLAEGFAAAGFSVELPRLPGHGTTVDDMMTTTWADWTGEAEDALQRLMQRCDKVVVAGQSMGGSLTLWLAAMYSRIDGIICINPATQPQPDEILEVAFGMLEEGTTVLPGLGSDIAAPGVQESSYAETPLAPLLSLMGGLSDLQLRYGQVTCPLLLLTSPQDHVVDPAQSDYLAEHAGGSVERVSLDRSYHVATLDHDRDLIVERAVAFARRVTG